MDPKPKISRQHSFTEQILDFCQFLRNRAFICTTSQEIDVLILLAQHIPEHNLAFHNILKAILVKNKTQFESFSALFTEYWGALDKAFDAKIQQKKEDTSKPKKNKAASLHTLKDWLFNHGTNEDLAAATYSNNEGKDRLDLTHIDHNDWDPYRSVINRLNKKLITKQKRRYQPTQKRRLLDWKKTVAHTIKQDENIFFKKHKKNTSQIVFLGDVSKSMELYTDFLLKILYGLKNTRSSFHGFVFGTQLYRIPKVVFNYLEAKKMIEELSVLEADWSGGTNIGACLDTLLQDYSNLANKKTTIIMLSDGWDQGDLHLFNETMKTLHQKTNKIIWINPLAGFSDYKPETMAMEIAMLYIDVFAPVYNLESLETFVAVF